MDTKNYLINRVKSKGGSISLSFLNYLLRGKKNASYHTAKTIVSVVGGSVETWMDGALVGMRNASIERYSKKINKPLNTKRGRPLEKVKGEKC